MLRDERFYPSFRQNALYVRMLAELDMLKDPSFRGSDDGDGESFNGSPTGSINLSLDDLSSMSSDDSTQLHAYISDTGKRLRGISTTSKPLTIVSLNYVLHLFLQVSFCFVVIFKLSFFLHHFLHSVLWFPLMLLLLTFENAYVRSVLS